MKKIILLFVFGLTALSCSSDDSGPALASGPEAKAQYDDSSFGIYKGVFVGSTGTILVNIYNEEASAATAEVTINGSTKTYTATGKIADGFAIEGLTFTNGSNSFDFNVDGDGDNPYINSINITGHPNARMSILKEYSDSLVKCYVGTYNGDDSGVFNIVIEGNIITGLAKSNSDDSGFSLYGTNVGTGVSGFFEGGEFTGNISGNSINGTWENDVPETGNWSGTRKL